MLLISLLTALSVKTASYTMFTLVLITTTLPLLNTNLEYITDTYNVPESLWFVAELVHILVVFSFLGLFKWALIWGAAHISLHHIALSLSNLGVYTLKDLEDFYYTTVIPFVESWFCWLVVGLLLWLRSPEVETILREVSFELIVYLGLIWAWLNEPILYFWLFVGLCIIAMVGIEVILQSVCFSLGFVCLNLSVLFQIRRRGSKRYQSWARANLAYLKSMRSEFEDWVLNLNALIRLLGRSNTRSNHNIGGLLMRLFSHFVGYEASWFYLLVLYLILIASCFNIGFTATLIYAVLLWQVLSVVALVVYYIWEVYVWLSRR